MRLEWVILAEGLAQDAKGAVTAISIGQNVIVSPGVPAVTKRAILAHLVGDKASLKTGDSIQFTISFKSPSGKMLQANTTSATVSTFAWPDLPHALDFPAEFILTCPEYGKYQIELEITGSNEETISRVLDFWVQAPPEGQIIEPRVAHNASA